MLQIKSDDYGQRSTCQLLALRMTLMLSSLRVKCLCIWLLRWPVVKNLPANEPTREVGSIPGLGRSSGGGNGNPLKSSCLENSMDRGAWWATVQTVAKSRTRLSNWGHTRMCVNTYIYMCVCISSVQLLSHLWLSVTPWTGAHQASLSITSSRSLLKLLSVVWVMPFNHLILCCPLLLLLSIFPSITVFQMSQFFASGSQRIGVSASASVLPLNI